MVVPPLTPKQECNFDWGVMGQDEQNELVRQIVTGMNLSTIVNAVGTQLGVSALGTSVTNLDSCFDALETEFRAPEVPSRQLNASLRK